MDNYFVFKGKNSLNYNIVIQDEWMPTIQDPMEEIEEVVVPGRDGVLLIKQGRKEPIYKAISAVALDENAKNNIRRWLKDDGRLILSNDKGVYYKAQIIEPVEFYYHWNEGWEFEIRFLCFPYAYLLTGDTVINITTRNTKINNQYAISKPLLKVFGSGDAEITINNQTIKLNIDGFATIDTELMISYKDTVNIPTSGNFPTFKNDENNITWLGNISKIEVIPRWRR